MKHIMRATLHDCASNTYFGQWPRVFPGSKGQNAGFIAQNGLVANAGFGRPTRARAIPQAIARRPVGNFNFDQKEKLAGCRAWNVGTSG